MPTPEESKIIDYTEDSRRNKSEEEPQQKMTDKFSEDEDYFFKDFIHTDLD